MITFFFSIVSTLIPFLIIFLVLRVVLRILQSILNGSGAKQPAEQKLPQEETAAEIKDLAQEFERKLKAKMDRHKQKPAKVVTDDKLVVYKENPVYFHEVKHASSAVENVAVQTVAVKKRFKHPQLVNGFVMSQVLEKPRSLNPYKDEF